MTQTYYVVQGPDGKILGLRNDGFGRSVYDFDNPDCKLLFDSESQARDSIYGAPIKVLKVILTTEEL